MCIRNLGRVVTCYAILALSILLFPHQPSSHCPYSGGSDQARTCGVAGGGSAAISGVSSIVLFSVSDTNRVSFLLFLTFFFSLSPHSGKVCLRSFLLSLSLHGLKVQRCGISADWRWRNSTRLPSGFFFFFYLLRGWKGGLVSPHRESERREAQKSRR